MTKMKTINQLPPTGMAARYEQAWNYVVNNLPAWKKKVIVDHDENDGSWVRISSEITHEVAMLAESEGWKPPAVAPPPAPYTPPTNPNEPF